jgi:dTDP-4-dehydrorhamnose reductase
VAAWSGSRGGELFGFPLQPIDLANRDALTAAFRETQPSLVIHAGAMSRVDACFQQPVLAWQANTRATQLLTDLAADADARLLYVSTDLVFDGETGWYNEQAEPSPVSIYGQTKAEAERAVMGYNRGVVVRVSLLFGPSITQRGSFFDHQVTTLRDGQPCILFDDEWRTPLSVLSAARGLIAIGESGYQGLLHFGGPERMTRWEMGQRLARTLGRDPAVFTPARRSEISSPEPRPRDTSLDSARWRAAFPDLPWPNWDEAMDELGVE